MTVRTTPSPCDYIIKPASSVTTFDHGLKKVAVTIRIKCEAPAATIDFVHGYRCSDHPPTWEQAYALHCHDDDRHDTAGAYRRTMIELLKSRIVTRYTQNDEAEAA